MFQTEEKTTICKIRRAREIAQKLSSILPALLNEPSFHIVSIVKCWKITNWFTCYSTYTINCRCVAYQFTAVCNSCTSEDNIL